MTTLTSDRVQIATDRPATDRLVAASAATDTVAYFDCFSPAATFVFHPEQTRLDDRAAYEAVWAS